MIIRDLDVIRVPVLPAKTDAVPIVDANAILPRPNSFQRFQPICRRRRNVSKLFRAVDLHESSKGDGANLLKRLDSPLVKDRLRILVAERTDQTNIILRLPLHALQKIVKTIVPTSARASFLDGDAGLFEQFVLVEVFDSLAHRLIADVKECRVGGNQTRSRPFPITGQN